MNGNETVTVELDRQDAQLVAGILQGEKIRARNANEKVDRDGAAQYAKVEERFITALQNQ